MTNPIDPTRWPVRNQAAPAPAASPLTQIGPSPGTFSGDFLRQLAIALCVGGAIYWLVERKRSPEGPQVLVLHPEDLGAFESLQREQLGGPFDPAARAYAASAMARDWMGRR